MYYYYYYSYSYSYYHHSYCSLSLSAHKRALFSTFPSFVKIPLMRERYRRNEDRIISERLFTREDIDEMDNRFEDVEGEDIIEDVD